MDGLSRRIIAERGAINTAPLTMQPVEEVTMAAEHSNRKHGHCSKSGKSKTYRTWRSMMQRCYRVKEKSYANYGARGISVCERWRDFVNFLADMGEVPDGMELDRIDNARGYEPGNCRWATRKMQMRNTRLTLMLTHNGTTRAAGDWADGAGLKVKTLKQRLKSGWDMDAALSTPLLTLKDASALGLRNRWGRIESISKPPAIGLKEGK